MRKLICAAVCSLALALWLAPAGADTEAQPAGDPPQVLEGRLIDLRCHTMGMEGDQHATCALQCAQKGLPVGLKEQTGKLYTVLLPAPKLASYMEKQVRLTGRVHDGALLAPTKMEVREGTGWKEVELPAAM
ncbi:MAG: hypothetical protein AB1505_19085 [Candidatus Latescibacterota bacterium]